MRALYLAIFVILFSTITMASQSSVPPKTASLAAAFAASLANQETKSKYGKEIFTAKDGIAILENGRWTWKATKGFLKRDIRATVSFALDGMAPKVELQILSSTLEE
jgi:hypothetical protein